MTNPPDFHALVGDEGTPEELAELRRAHEYLIAAGPPPELSPRIAEAPKTPSAGGSWVPRRRRGAALVLAAGVVAAAFGIGFLVADRNSGQFAHAGGQVAMHAPLPGSTARASILIGERDSVGNWPLLVRATGLKPLPKGDWYELYLTRGGKWVAYCGAFSVEGSGRTSVQFSVPYRLKGAGWVVTTTKHAREHQVLLTT
jgi:hypothetical protein